MNQRLIKNPLIIMVLTCLTLIWSLYPIILSLTNYTIEQLIIQLVVLGVFSILSVLVLNNEIKSLHTKGGMKQK